MGMKPGSLCLVVSDLAAIVPFADHRIHQLRQHGWRVRILGIRPATAATRRRLERAGIGFTCLEDRAPPRELRAADVHEPEILHVSDRVHWALGELHRRHDFDLIEFAGTAAPAFRLLQARRAGAGFGDVGIIVAPRRRSATTPISSAQLLADYMEQCAADWADFRADNACRPADVLACHDRMLAQVRGSAWANASGSAPAESRPLVTVVVHYSDQSALLPLALRSLADQTYRNLEVHVIDDGSDDENACMVFAQQERQHPGFAFERQPRAGAWTGRNRILAGTAGEFFLPLTADTVLRPALVEHLVHALHHQPDCAAVVCYLLGFDYPGALVRERFSGACRPSGGPLLLGGISNIWGEGGGLFRTDALRAVGGFVRPAPASAESDWPTYARLACGGQEVVVLPEHLAYQRRRAPTPAQLAATHRQVLEQYRQAPSWSEHESTALARLCQEPPPSRPPPAAAPPLRQRLLRRAGQLLRPW